MGDKHKKKRKAPPPTIPNSSSYTESSEKINGTAARSTRSRIKTEPEPEPEPEQAKKPASWTKENEVVLLKSIIQFNFQNDHASFCKNDFLAFIVECLAGEFRESQVDDKIKRMKKRYQKTGDNRSPPSDSLDNEIFCLATKLWGPIKTNGDSPVNSVEPEAEKREGNINFHINFDSQGHEFGNVSGLLSKATEITVDAGTNGELEKMNMEIRVSEIELCLKKNELLKQRLLMALEASKSKPSAKFLCCLPAEQGGK